MPEETTPEAPPETDGPAIAHDDIMQRLLEYQRHLREGEPPAPPETPEPERPLIDSAAAESIPSTPAEDVRVVDLTQAEAELEAASEPEVEIAVHSAAERGTAEPALSDPSARIAELEATLDRVTQMLAELRERFADMAISADERISGIEDALSEVRRASAT